MSKNKRASSLSKLIDKYIGPLLLLLLSIFRVKRLFDDEDVKKIAILKSAAIGDTILLSGIVTDLKKQYPNCCIHFFAGPSNIPVLENIEAVDEVFNLTMKNIVYDVKLIRRHDYDLFFDFGAWPRINALYAYFSRSSLTIGFKTKNQRRHYCFDRGIEHNSSIHEFENYRNLLRSIGVSVQSPPSLIVSEALPPLFTSKSYIIFHLAAGGYNSHLRQWPIENWAWLAKNLEQNNDKIFLTGAPSDIETNNQLSSLYPGVHNIAGDFSLSQTITILSQAKLVVSVNTGIMHMASCLQVPTLSLNGPTNDKRWGPIGHRSLSVNAEAKNCGFLNLGFEYKNQREDCMNTISRETVLKKCQILLSKD